MDGTAINERISIKLVDDNMRAVVTFEPAGPGGEALTREQIIKAIEKSGIKKGIDKKVLGQMLSAHKSEDTYILAMGLQPGAGRDGKVNLSFDPSKQGFKPVILPDGSADMKNLDSMTLVEKWDVVADLIEPQTGTDGYDVLGKVLPGTAGKPVVLPKGKGTIISEDGTQLLADTHGRIIYTEGKVNISDVHEIKGDVGPATGNITFNGTVVVRGNVQTDFTIRATGDVEVHGVIEGAEIYAGGNVLATHGISGVEQGVVQANGNLTCKSIQNANLEIKGDVFAEVIMHSELKVKGKVEVGGQKGLLVGGTLKSRQGVVAKVVGSRMGTKTRIHIGGDNDYLSQYNEYLSEHKKVSLEYQENLVHLENMMKQRKAQEAGGRAVSEKIRNSLLNTINNTNQLKSQMNALQTRIEELKALVETDLTVATLSVEGITYPGLDLRIGNAKTIIDQEESHVIFRNTEGVIMTNSLS